MGMKPSEAQGFLLLMPAKDVPVAQELAAKPATLSPQDEAAAQVQADEEQAASASAVKEAAFRAELYSVLKLSELKKRARAIDGISDNDVDRVDDADEPKAAIIQLLIKTEEVIWAQEAKAAATAAAKAKIAAEEEAARISADVRMKLLQTVIWLAPWLALTGGAQRRTECRCILACIHYFTTHTNSHCQRQFSVITSPAAA